MHQALTTYYFFTALHLASSQGHKDCVDILSRQSDTAVDQPDGTGCTPLFYACATDQVETARILLDADANPDCNSKDGKRFAIVYSVFYHRSTFTYFLCSTFMFLSDNRGCKFVDIIEK